MAYVNPMKNQNQPPAFKGSTVSSRIPASTPFSKAPLSKLSMDLGMVPDLETCSDAGCGTGSHPAFDDSRIKATVVPTDSPYDQRSGFSKQVMRTACKMDKSKARPFAA